MCWMIVGYTGVAGSDKTVGELEGCTSNAIEGNAWRNEREKGAGKRYSGENAAEARCVLRK